jgi:hypothetical protein
MGKRQRKIEPNRADEHLISKEHQQSTENHLQALDSSLKNQPSVMNLLQVIENKFKMMRF